MVEEFADTERHLTSNSLTPATPNEKLFEKLLGTANDQTFIEDEDSLLGDYDWEISFDEVDDHISSFQEDEFVREAFTKGMDLREYARNVEKELNGIEKEHEVDYISQAKNFVELHNQIQSCDQILATMENMLSVFQMDLGNISSEIQTLQDKSFSMNIKLKNRTAVEQQLNTVLEGTVIPPPMIKKITEGEVDEIWLAYLTELNKKMTYVKRNQKMNVKAIKDVGPELEKLRLKATEKIRDFLLTKIRSLRIPNTNVQILQQSILLKYKALYKFLMERYSEVAVEVMHNYVNTMRWYFFNHFEKYNRELQKLQNPVADKYDMMGYDESVRKGGLWGTGKIALQDKANIYVLKDRIKTLRNQDAGVILVHVAENKSKGYPNEALFRSFNLTFIDNASSEYLFIVEFFAKDDKPNAELAKDIFSEIFNTTIKMGLDSTKQFVDNSYDAIGILICIRLNTQFALELQRRKVPALEGYTNQINMLLWPRFQAIMNMHIDSVKKAATKFIVKDIHPHFVTRRYGEFAASILTLNEEYNDPILLNSLLRLRNEVENFLDKLSNNFDDRKSRIIFLINNYNQIITILNDTGGKVIEAEVNYFKELLNGQISGFVEEELQPHFGSLVSFIKNVEQGKDLTVIEPEIFDQVSSDFAATWRQSITSINTSVIQHFTNFKNGTTILHSVLGQLIIYYTRFCNMLEEALRDGKIRIRHQPVNVQSVMVEIKKFRSNF
ncbi:Vps52-domain-containing protein [Rhizophagus irregularis]|uniref:Vps52-domain-containing protein n=1 Tax=Rhizophagus irregularis TaxID=588596 RepID=A0A2N0SD75_9GLOM|nr:Vps52-domain-containing protein [Rhizophagus irregularis]